MYTLKSMPSHQEHLLRQERLVFNFTIVGNATPADKQHSVDIPGLVILRTEGQTAQADAIETLAWTTPVDNNSDDSIFGILLGEGAEEQLTNQDIADKVYIVEMVEVTATSTSEVLTGPGAAAGAFLTAEGNIAIEVAATDLNLATDTATFTVVVEYREA